MRFNDAGFIIWNMKIDLDKYNDNENYSDD